MAKKNEQLTHKTPNVWKSMNDKQRNEVFEFSEGYKSFLDASKTERQCASEIKRLAESKGYVSLEEVLKSDKPLKKGEKIYAHNRDKSIILFQIGDELIETGINIVGTHIDSPRLDLKANPVYEADEMAFLKTHYYGGIKKYQWLTIPLAFYGAVIKKGGEKVDITIGDDENDPVFTITDLLPHLGKDQMKKTASELVVGEQLNVLVGSFGDDKEEKDSVKYAFLNLLNEKYGITEKDFISAEVEIVPAGKARDLGLDRSMVLAYGQDDRVCAYTALEAILDVKSPTKTACAMFMDKEEVGSNGNTGSMSEYFEYALAELIYKQTGNYNELLLKRCLKNTKVLSGDVGAAFDPNYPEAYEKQNSAHLGFGVQVVKYTGSGGKYSCNDANAEFLSEVIDIFENSKVLWQTGELGKVDQGGGGTIAFILANANAEVLDCGTPVLSMHSPHEVASKSDIYMTYKGYHAFLNR